ncbi:DUF169 domain-containing protein [Desulfosudis oleivorans]|uniref:DUF169 domain-containing protein n=1 Tax=Desulfosudis oleivorans (strain DSM 6200 / JCM 39069 / Hxd3) TaxID=96561 RepID=A8ZYH1_DESOH|nr:DUF169 domain-containing protein [Desulfosudis oleivorans]ABW68696.1 protein of unknown function DUF169 [Desulfosudis oleivorans Hxd3]
MESVIAKALDPEHAPVAVMLSGTKPDNALGFKPGRWGCVMFMFANAVRGKTAAFDRTTYGCWGGGVGLGFGNAYEQFPGGVPCFTRFLSSGNKQWETGRQVGQAVAENAGKEFADNFLNGEAYVKSPDLVDRFLEALPIMDHGSPYVIFKPLAEVDAATETPETVVFTVDPDRVSALVILANYGRGGMENAIIPWAAGCQTIGIIPFKEAQSDCPRAVVGLTDISARKYTQNLLGRNVLTVALPWRLFCEMETNVPGSFLERHTWHSLVEKK